ncbi:MAG: hypothetical protein ACMUHX_08595 [bacterium]
MVESSTGQQLSPVIQLFVDGNGKVVKVLNAMGEALTNADYAPNEQKRIDVDGVLASVNWCCWRLVDGQWKCGPCS